MKKLISVLFAALLLAAVLPLGAYADSEGSLTFIFDKNHSPSSPDERIALDAVNGECGWSVDSKCELRVNILVHKLTLTRIVAEVSAGVANCGDISVSYGTMQQDGNTVTVTNINNTSCYFTSNNTEPVEFSQITVYYAHAHIYFCECGDVYIPAHGGEASTLSEGNMTIVCTVAGIAVGLVGGLLLGRKKKPKTATEE